VVVLDIVTAVAVSGSFLVQELVSTVPRALTGFIQVHIEHEPPDTLYSTFE
jgi:hypothetical protein